MPVRHPRWVHCLFLAFSFCQIVFLNPELVQSAEPQPATWLGQEFVFREGLVLPTGSNRRRELVHTDPIEAQLVAGRWHSPTNGEPVGSGDKPPTWSRVQANPAGWVDHPALQKGGYAFFELVSTQAQALVLEMAGNNLAYVNRELRAGDAYSYGFVQLPVWLRAGTNEFLFQASRGKFQAKLKPATGPLRILSGDALLPDVIVGGRDPLIGGIVVLNQSTNTWRDLVIEPAGGTAKPGRAFPFDLPPLTARKAPFELVVTNVPGTNAISIELALIKKGEPAALAKTKVTLRLRQKWQTHKRTFLSDIDGSAQYYAVQPPPEKYSSLENPALFLSLHGASVEATGQVEAYSPKTWGYIVAPTNRRPFGFDWEDWGREDALEALAHAKEQFHIDPTRVYLTGHSMGGHGVWQLGALFPDRFAALGPSAAWVSFASYGGGTKPATLTPVEEILERSRATSHTLALQTNYLQEGIYILHGSSDDNVPVAEARNMKRVLSGFHHDFDYFEQPGAGHWWDASDEPGADCVDWAPMFDFFARHSLPRSPAHIRQFQFVTVSPAASDKCLWLAIEAQTRPYFPSRVDARFDPNQRRVTLRTENVGRLELDRAALNVLGELHLVEIDGQKFEKLTPRLRFERLRNRWDVAPEIAPLFKSPQRQGPFKQAFRHRVWLVYGSHGTPEENAWAFNKARYDSESFWVRGNGSFEIISDDAYLQRRADKAAAGHNVILYGHAESNRAWETLLRDCPVQVRRGSVKVGSRGWDGQEWACLFVRPMPGTTENLVAAVAGSGLAGLRLTERLPYFLSGVGVPDWIVLKSEMLVSGSAGVVGAGFFGMDWGFDSGEFVWADQTATANRQPKP